jgi:hypothetical protein
MSVQVKIDKLRIKTLAQKCRRLKQKIGSIERMFNNLKKKDLLEAEAAITLTALYEGQAGELIKNQINNQRKSKQGQRYSDEIKAFALSLHYHGPKAYNYLR